MEGTTSRRDGGLLEGEGRGVDNPQPTKSISRSAMLHIYDKVFMYEGACMVLSSSSQFFA